MSCLYEFDFFFILFVVTLNHPVHHVHHGSPAPHEFCELHVMSAVKICDSSLQWNKREQRTGVPSSVLIRHATKFLQF